MERIRGIVVRTLTILAGFWIADLAAARVQAGIAAGESIERIMDGMTTMLQHPTALGFDRTSLLCGLGGAGVFCQVVIGQCGVSFPSEKAVGFSPVRNWPVIARVLLFHCIRA